MPLVKKEESTKYTYALWRIDESLNDLITQLNPNKEERIAIERFRNIKRRKQNISARLILNMLAKKKEIISYSKNGTPKSNLFKYISISHSNKYCILIASNVNIGVDIQYINPNIEKISDKFLNSIEKNRINKKNPIHEMHFIWCAKESIYKTLNNVPCSFKKNIEIEAINDNMKTIGYYKNNNTRTTYNIEYKLLENYFIGIATKQL
ncbi:MAG: hypothetical protein CMP54_03745 [Flavobacteriales bacterium]|nr:hypothetical protein [Flavobacteriales bacterium]|tara:strand:- start:977 stop:1600 length:624 start_codon:yes stop_codon:yes gene_type:complete